MRPPRPDATRADAERAIRIGNAGLVLLAPFLPTLFERLELSSDDGHGGRTIVGIDGLSRAVHLLQYLVDGRTDAPAPELTLNKLLSGVAVTQAVAPGIVLDDAAVSVCDSLLCAVVARWPALGHSSPRALQEVFLRREGRLSRGDAGWELQVPRKNVDILIDRIPWSFALVGLPFMAEPISVTW